MTLGMFFSLISVQNIGAAYRHIQGGLGAAPDQVSWVITSFLIAEVIMLPLSGWLSRAMSLKTFFFMCSMGFSIVSISMSVSSISMSVSLIDFTSFSMPYTRIQR